MALNEPRNLGQPEMVDGSIPLPSAIQNRTIAVRIPQPWEHTPKILSSVTEGIEPSLTAFNTLKDIAARYDIQVQQSTHTQLDPHDMFIALFQQQWDVDENNIIITQTKQRHVDEK